MDDKKLKTFVCKKCLTNNTKENMTETHTNYKGKIYCYYYDCKKCTNSSRNKYRKKKRRARGLKTIVGRPFKKYHLKINGGFLPEENQEWDNVTIPEIEKITGINHLILRNIIKGRIKKKYNHINIKEL